MLLWKRSMISGSFDRTRCKKATGKSGEGDAASQLMFLFMVEVLYVLVEYV